MINYFNFSTSIGWIAILYVVNILLIFAVIFTERKSPSATLAWVMVLAFIPIVGFVFYIEFRRNTYTGVLVSSRQERRRLVGNQLGYNIFYCRNDGYG